MDHFTPMNQGRVRVAVSTIPAKSSTADWASVLLNCRFRRLPGGLPTIHSVGQLPENTPLHVTSALSSIFTGGLVFYTIEMLEKEKEY